MAHIEISGVRIAYDLLGPVGAPCIALTPGGRFGKDEPDLRKLGEALAAGGRRVLLWDRPNCGDSDLCFEGPNESALQGRILAGLIRALDLGPTALAGGSAGSRTALLAAVHDPQIVTHIALWWISGGTVSLFMLGSSYCCESAVAACMGGMEAVAQLPAWKAQVERDPAKRAFLLRQDPQAFIATMERWTEAFIPSPTSPVPGMTAADFAGLTVPVLVFRGSETDIFHPAKTSEWVQRLTPGAQFADPPWGPDAPMQCLGAAIQSGGGHFLDWPKLAPQILDFTASGR